jgi:hypothetical protein
MIMPALMAQAPLALRRDEMAFRKCYEALLLTRNISTVFRPGNREHPNWRGYIVGEIVTARVIERCGCDRLRVPPQFNSVRMPIQITRLSVSSVESLRPEDFAGSSPDVYHCASLLDHLLRIYQKPIEAFGHMVTRIEFRHVR